jgi:hypothetical protein
VVVYASYKAELASGTGITRTRKGTTSRTRLVGREIIMENKKASDPDTAYIERQRYDFFYKMDEYMITNAPPLVNRIDIKMENGDSYRWER